MQPRAFLPTLALALLACACGDSRAADSAPRATGEVSATSVATETPPPTPEPTPTAPVLTAELGRTFWSAQIGVSPLAVHLRPGRDPDADPWTVEAGGLRFVCTPTPAPGGWRLDGCTGSYPGVDISLDVPTVADHPMPFELTDTTVEPPRQFTGELRRVLDADEDQAANTTLEWRARDVTLGANTDLWVEDGVVFAPHIDGYVELLSAATGEQLSVIDVYVVPGVREAEPVALDAKAHDGLLYVATAFHGVVAYDVSDATAPSQVGQYVVDAPDESPEGVWSIHNIALSPDGGTLYVINQSPWSMDLRIVDASDPAALREVGRYAYVPAPEELDGQEEFFPHDAQALDLDGREILFLNYWDAGVRFLDVSDPARIVELGAWDDDAVHSHAGWPFEAAGRLYYAHGGEGTDQDLTVLDVTDFANPSVIGHYRTRDGISIHNIEVRDGFAYIAYYLDGLRVVDLRDASAPTEVAHYDTVSARQERSLFQGAWGVRVDGDRVYLSDMQAGIHAFAVALPSD